MLRIILFGIALLTGSMLAIGAAIGAEGRECERMALEVACSVSPARTVLVGDPFRATATVRNTGNVDIRDLVISLESGPGVSHIGSGELHLVVDLLPAGKTQVLEATFVGEQVGECRITASARDKLSSAAAGCICTMLVVGLPALQVEMIDTDEAGREKGVFEVGELVRYALQVQNDVGTAATPELRVVWTLPPELTFVSGTGEKSVEITGSGRSARSGSFTLARDEVWNCELLARVLAVPPSNLVQTAAVVETAAGAQPLAIESESTTLKAGKP